MSNTERKTRVRYSRLSRENRTPKNTLVTVLEGDTVYFGIARCNRKLDTFHKILGSHIATERADIARADVASDNPLTETEYTEFVTDLKVDFTLHKSGLRGSVPLVNVKEVVNYFRTVDEFCLELTPRARSVEV